MSDSLTSPMTNQPTASRRTISTFGVLLAFLVRDWRFAVSYRFDLALQCGSVLFHVAALYFMSRMIGANAATDPYGGYLPFAAIGMAMISWFQASFDSFAHAIHREQLHGTLEALLLAPQRLGTVVAGSSLYRLLRALLFGALYAGTAAVLYRVPLRGDPLLVATLLALTALAFASLGLLSASFLMLFKRGDPIGMAMGALSLLLGGVFYPVQALPAWLQTAAQMLPITHGLDALRQVLLRGQGWSDVQTPLLVLGAFAGIGLPVGLWCFQRAVRIAGREGTLLQY